MIKSLLSKHRQLTAATLGVTNLFFATGCHAQTPATGAVRTVAQAQTVPGQRPNVLLILADDLGWSDLSCMGSEIRTPNIDALGSSGLTFTQMYNSARCCPTRASLLTGLTPHQAGFPLMNGRLSDHSVTLPEVLKDAGYSTSMVGKWHLGGEVTPTDRGFSEFYGMIGGFNSFWKEDPWYTRAPAGHPKREYKPGQFYSTDAFADYSMDFIDQSKASGKPWFQYLAFNAPHFPLQAPEADIAKYEKVYAQGWDKIREGRVARQKKLGLLPQNVSLTPRSVVPKNWINEKTGWADKDNPAWDSLPADRQADLARRMAVYAAMVDRMDQAVGRVVKHLKDTGQYDNTLIFFLSDNGACAEWDPYGFDKLDSTLNIVHKGEDLKKIGTEESYISYGSGWANASNTPWRLYKHYGHEGGTRTPLLVHWPQGLKNTVGKRSNVPGSIEDFMPTLVEVCGAKYPAERNGQSIMPTKGVSLLPLLKGGTIPARSIFMEHEGNRSVRQGDWKLVAIHDKPWELYNLATDPTEMNNLAAGQGERVQKMAADWENWAENSMVKPKTKPNPDLVNKAITITAEVTPQAADGVILAQGGNQRGYALYLDAGKPVFVVRQAGQIYTAAAPQAPQGRFTLEAHMEKDGSMRLLVNGKEAARAKAPGVFTVQPTDSLSIGEDEQSAVGTYQAPHALKAKIENVKVTTN